MDDTETLAYRLEVVIRENERLMAENQVLIDEHEILVNQLHEMRVRAGEEPWEV